MAKDATYKQIQQAHDQFFQDVALTYNSTIQRFQLIQTEFEKATEKAWQTQDPNAVQEAQGEFQNSFQAACNDASPVETFGEAYRNYKMAVQKAIKDANVDEIDHTDMAHLSQSLYMVSQTAMSLTSAGQPAAANNNPFQQAEDS